MKIHINIKSVFNLLKERSRKTWLIIGCASALIIVLVIVVFPKTLNIATVEVAKDEFIIDLQTRGEIDALNSTSVSVPRMRKRMSLKIIDMAPEGEIVKKGAFRFFQLNLSLPYIQFSSQHGCFVNYFL